MHYDAAGTCKLYDSQTLMIFQSELTTLDSQINQLLAQVAAARQKQAQLTELDVLTDSSLMQLKDVVSKVGHYDKSAIASLKTAVLNLFDPGDQGDNGGNQPIDPTPDTDPTPGNELESGDCLTTDELDDKDDFDIIALNGETGDCLTTDELDDKDDAHTKLTYAQAIKRRCSACWGFEVTSKGDIKAGFINRANLNFMQAVNLERSGREFYETVEGYLDRLYYTGQACDIDKAPLTGQACDWASPFASHLACVLWEDALLTGQHCAANFGCDENQDTGKNEQTPYAEFVEVSDRVGYVKVVHSGEIKATFAGFTRKDYASAWGRLLAMTYGIASGFEVRPAKHLPFKWELKLWGMTMVQIQKLASEDLTKSPRVEVNSVQPPARKPVILDSDRVVVGQRIVTKDGQTLEISSTLSADNRFFAKDANEQRQLIELDNVAEFLPTESPAQAAGIEPPADWGKPQVVSATTAPTLKARINLESSTWNGQICEVLEVSPDGHWWKLQLPNGRELKYPSDTIEPIEEKAVQPNEKIEFNDLIEVVGDANDCVGLVGSFGRVKIIGETRIGVEIDEQLVYFNPSELRIKAKEEVATQRTSLQSGQLLMGDRIITTGKYIGERRVSQLLNAKLGTADKIAAIELAKDLKNLGLDPQLAISVMAGGEVDDAEDF